LSLVSFLVLFSCSIRVWKCYRFSWPAVVLWWICVGLILASILSPLFFSLCFLSGFACSTPCFISAIRALCPKHTVGPSDRLPSLGAGGLFFSWDLELLLAFLTPWAHTFWPVQLWTVQELKLVGNKLLNAVQCKIIIGFWFSSSVEQNIYKIYIKYLYKNTFYSWRSIAGR